MGKAAHMQLVALGATDVFLTGEPQRSLWKRNATRRTNFALESVENAFNVRYGAPTVVTIQKLGDLLKSCVLEISMKRSSTESFYPAEQFVKSITVMIGGKEIETIRDFPNWSRVRDELFRDSDARSANYRMQNFRNDDPPGAIRTFYMDLPLFFSNHISNALPLVALQNHDVQLKITFNEQYNIPGVDPIYMAQAKLYADYVFLDTFEREYFAYNPHEYIIEQLQTFTAPSNMTDSVVTFIHDLPFSLPVRYLVWFYKSNVHGQYTTSNVSFETNDAFAPLCRACLKCNNEIRFSERPGSYFNLVQPLQAVGRAPSAGIYMYSFGVKAAEQDSMGTLNFSLVDMVSLSITNKAATAAGISDILDTSTTLDAGITKFEDVVVFAKNFNVLRIQDGSGVVLFN
jgi:hypothetical protein